MTFLIAGDLKQVDIGGLQFGAVDTKLRPEFVELVSA